MSYVSVVAKQHPQLYLYLLCGDILESIAGFFNIANKNERNILVTFLLVHRLKMEPRTSGNIFLGSHVLEAFRVNRLPKHVLKQTFLTHSLCGNDIASEESYHRSRVMTKVKRTMVQRCRPTRSQRTKTHRKNDPYHDHCSKCSSQLSSCGCRFYGDLDGKLHIDLDDGSCECGNHLYGECNFCDNLCNRCGSSLRGSGCDRCDDEY